jgi:hypothetical protein
LAASPSMIWRAALVVASCFVSIAVGLGLNIPCGIAACRTAVSDYGKKKGRDLPDLSLLRSAASASTSVVKDQRNNLCGLQVLGRALAAAVILHDVEGELLALDE